MKKYFFGLVIFLTLNGCVVTHTNYNLMEFDKSMLGSKTQIVTKAFNGSALILSLLPIGEEPDTKASLMELMTENKCTALKNIEIEFYQRSFILVGFPRTIISAHCIK